MKNAGIALFAVALVSLVISSTACPPSFGNCYVFPPNDEWNRPIDNDPVDYMSSCTLDHISSTMMWSGDSRNGYTTAMLRLDAGVEASDTYGMPYTIVSSKPALLKLNFGQDEDYRDESDFYLSTGVKTTGDDDSTSQAYLRVPTGAAIEGWGGTPSTDPTEGDRHMIVFDTSTCTLTETYSTVRSSNAYSVANSAIFNTSKVLPQRPAGWTSADAAGLPIFPGILKYAEVQAGSINHALRFTIPTVQNAYAAPASKRGTSSNTLEAYYGARFRLKSSFDDTSYSADSKVLIQALKTYGLMLADQGSASFITAENNAGFDNGLLDDFNSGRAGSSKRIAFTKDNWEMVQVPGATGIVWPLGKPSTGLTCNGVTKNPAVYTPSFNPSCPTLPSSSPSAPSSTPKSSTPSATPSATPRSSTTPTSTSNPSSSPSSSSTPTNDNPSPDAPTNAGSVSSLPLTTVYVALASIALMLL